MGEGIKSAPRPLAGEGLGEREYACNISLQQQFVIYSASLFKGRINNALAFANLRLKSFT